MKMLSNLDNARESTCLYRRGGQRRNHILMSCCLLMGAASASAQVQPNTGQGALQRQAEEKVLMHLPAPSAYTFAFPFQPLRVSPDMAHVAYVSYAGNELAGTWTVVMDGLLISGHRRRAFDGASAEDLRFTSEGRLRYTARGEGRRWSQRIDGKVVCDLKCVLSNDTQRTALIRRDERQKKDSLVVDGQVVADAALDSISKLTFSPDSKRFAYVMDNKNSSFVIVDSTQFGPYERVADVVFSPDSKRFGIVASRGKQSFVVVDGKPHSHNGVMAYLFEYIRDRNVLTFSRDGGSIAYAMLIEKKWFVIVDDHSEGKYDEVGPITFFMNRPTYRAKISKKWHAVMNGVPGPAFDEVGELLVSDDEKRLAYRAKLGKRWHLVTDDKVGPSFEDVTQVEFSHDGTRLAYVGIRDKKAVLVLDGREVASYPAIASLTFSPDGRRLAYFARLSETAYVTRRIGLEGLIDGLVAGPWTLVIDGNEGPRYGYVLEHVPDGRTRDVPRLPSRRAFVFDGNETIRYVVIQKDVVRAVTERLIQGSD